MSLSAATLAAFLALHAWAGPVNSSLTTNLSEVPVTISVPATEPPLMEYGWVGEIAALGTFSQVGWGWGPSTQCPRVFAYTTTPTDPNGTYYWGPCLQPGGTVTVKMVDTPSTWNDAVLVGSRWVTIYWAPITPTPYAPVWGVDAETYGPWDGPVCFSGLVSGKTCWA